MKNIVAGNITFSIDIKKDNLGLNHVLTKVRDGIRNIFLYGETEFETSKQLVDYIESLVMGKILAYDMSISTEDRVLLLKESGLKGEYHISEIEGPKITFDNVQERNLDEFTVAIREAELSTQYGNRVIKIDKIY